MNALTIRAAVLQAPNAALELQDLELEAPREHEIRVRVLATGVCHTDISVMTRPFPVDRPIVLGHEGAGIVESVGAAITKVAPGDRVVMSYNSCGHCSTCRAHAPSYCQYFFGSNFLGQRADGGTALQRHGQPVRHHFFGQSSFATHCLCTERNVVKVPSSVSDELFPLLGPLGCGLQTGAGAIINVLKPQLGDCVVVFGTGAVGLAAVMAARAVGAGQVIAVDRLASRLELALELGATHTILASSDTDTVAEIRRLTGTGLGASVSLDTTAVSTVVAVELGINPVWFGVFVVVMIEVGMLTPPVGMNVFTVKSLLPEVPLWTIYRGVAPFIVANLLLVALILIWPDLVVGPLRWF